MLTSEATYVCSIGLHTCASLFGPLHETGEVAIAEEEKFESEAVATCKIATHRFSWVPTTP
jgi:hypothetical protein